MKTESAPSLFISDLHLTPDEPATTDCFLHFLAGPARSARALYILGDLFEVWLGDDDLLNDPWQASIVAALRELTDAGVALFVMHGNRDFLLGEAFRLASGARLLSDPYSLDLDGTHTLLTHGDELCADDLAYQRFRAQVRDPEWRRGFLAKPLPERRALARHLREQSEMAKSEKSMASMDVNDTAVIEAFRRHACARMIHGHTHRPRRHAHQVDGRTCERWVLPDWQATGGYLHCDATGCRLLPFDCAPA